MFSRLLGKYEDIPLAEQKRKRTDILCCVVSSLLALGMFVFALVTYIQLVSTTSLSYFHIPPHVVNPGPGNITAFDYYGFMWTLLISTVCCIGLGIFWMAVVQLAPLAMPKVAAAMAILGLLVITVFCFLVHNQLFANHNWSRYVIAGVAVLAIVVLVCYLLLYGNELRFQGLMLKLGTSFLAEKWTVFLFIPLFLLFSAGLVALIFFQQVAFSLRWSRNNNLFDLSNPGVFGILNIIELLWGVRFLKDAFIFVVSGQAVDWYWRGKYTIEGCPGFNNCMRFNWGSIAVGSFLNSVLRLPLLVLELLICHPTACCNMCGNCCYDNCCQNLVDLVRTDVYAYCNLFGSGYCEACRECRHLCFQFTQFQGSQSPMRNYRIAIRLAIWTMGFIAAYAIMNVRVLFDGIWFMAELALLVSLVTGFFVSIGASAAQGMQVSFMVENQFVGGYSSMRHCDQEVRRGVEGLSREGRRDGGC